METKIDVAALRKAFMLQRDIAEKITKLNAAVELLPIEMSRMQRDAILQLRVTQSELQAKFNRWMTELEWAEKPAVKSTKRYRAEWLHNGQWKMDEDGSGTFATRSRADRHNAQVKAKYPSLEVRVVEVA
ncbi:MAG: hypothetical protein UMS36scaffold28_56 [Phage 59_13]|nr:MAG: hypothetical protein UMS36scaffold28_56 [Phage 59_13]